jgi:hypothetical protein
VARAAASAARWAALALSLLPAAARAQATLPPVDTAAGPTVAGGRVLGLGGAFVAVAEGVAGASVNPAAAAQRPPRLDRGWDVDGILTWYVPARGELSRTDVDNDGAADGAYTGASDALLGGQLQLGRLGLAVVAQGWGLSRDGPAGERREIGTTTVQLTGAWAGFRDALLVGGGLTAAGGHVAFTPGGGARQAIHYGASTLHLGALWRPRARPWRAGLAFRTAASPGPDGALAGAPIATPRSFVVPWVVSAGAAVWIGPNAGRVNEPSYAALRRHPDWGEGPAYQPSARSPVLLTAQLDLTGKAPGAIALGAVVGGPASPSGRAPSLTPRLGAEWAVVPSWAHLRAGTYLEPSRTGSRPRLHGTFGAEVKVPASRLGWFPWDLQLSAGGDVAPRYRNVSLSLGFWSVLAPPPPLPTAAPPAG